MKLVKPSYQILSKIDDTEILKSIERAGRTCYKSEDKITDESCKQFVKMILKRGHESVVEHEKITVKFVCDRGVSHEIVRHRIASFSQESTRYVDYNKKGIEFIIPCWINIKPNTEFITHGEFEHEKESPEKDWFDTMLNSEFVYNDLIQSGWKPEQARSVLPNSLKTEIVVTANLREWREIFRQRTAKAAHPQMRELMCPLLDELKIKLPVIFDDITY